MPISENNKIGTDQQFVDKSNYGRLSAIKRFFNRVKGNDTLRVGGGGGESKPVKLASPMTDIEREKKLKIHYISEYIRNKSYNRQHIMYYDEYRKMCSSYPLINSGLDIHAEEVCSKGIEDNHIFKVNSKYKNVKEELEKLFFDVLKIDTKGFLIARETLKLGNTFGYLVTRPKDGVVDVVFLPPDSVIREQMYDPDDFQRYRYMWYGSGNVSFEPWEIVHWKNISDIENEPYGTSMLRSILDTWRRVILLREALIVYRITRAPQRFVFKIATDGMTGEEALKYAEEMKKEIKKKPMVNPKTGEIDFKFNPLTVEDDFFIPTTAQNSSNVETVGGVTNLNDIEDYKIIKDDLFVGLKIPKSYLTFEEQLSNKGALVEEDIRFAKTIQREQSVFAEGIVQIGIVHLFHKGYKMNEITSFSIEMNHSSTGSEKRKWEILSEKLDAADKMWDKNNTKLNLLSYTDVLKMIFKFNNEEIKNIIKRQFYEKKIMWRLEKLAQDGSYDEPELDAALGKINDLSIDGNINKSVFKGLLLENDSYISQKLKEKIDKDIESMIGTPPIVSSNLDKVKEYGTIVNHINETKKRLEV